ncbi:YceI family protein [Rubrivirga sp. IMCC43871]|uniref:YceI family protein n=1 Tax=Rubrivirga sp. IMCC43871 TaxID=3391575 RepID=UPI00398FA2B0
MTSYPMRALALFSLALVVGPAAAQTFAADRGTVTFTSRVPLHSFTGTSGHLTGEIDTATRAVDFYVDLETLETGIGRRDRDMRETLETDRFPFAEFTGRLMTPLDLGRRGAQSARVEGTFTLHGVARPMVAVGTIERTDRGLRVRAEWEVRLDDHRITPPRLLMIKVDPVQAVAIDVLLRPR